MTLRTLRVFFALIALSVVTVSCNSAKKAKEAEAAKKAAAAQKPKPKKGDIQPYNKVITKDAKSDEGLFTVHKVDDNYYYEINDSLFEREMLMVSRIAKTASGIGFGGGKFNEQVLRWQKKTKRYCFVWYHMKYSLPTHFRCTRPS